jgi:hypothetical protein
MSRRNQRRQARSTILWGLAGFAALQALFIFVMDGPVPELRDPEYGYKLAELKSRLAESPHRPLYLVLGSSRAGLGICPQVMKERSADGLQSPLVFNFAITGSGPLLELLCLKRLLAAGIRPDHILIEVLPPLLHQEDPWGENSWYDYNRLSFRDLLVWQKYSSSTWEIWGNWLRARMAPCYHERFCIMSRYAPGWLAWGVRQDGWRGVDRYGWIRYPQDEVNAEDHQRALEAARIQYLPTMDHFHLSERPQRALREVLDLCDRRHIPRTLLIMPEGSTFQAYYPPGAREMIVAYLRGLSREYHASLIDMRGWMPDGSFLDSHHLLPPGAKLFTQRFEHEVLQPMFEASILAQRGGEQRTIR